LAPENATPEVVTEPLANSTTKETVRPERGLFAPVDITFVVVPHAVSEMTVMDRASLSRVCILIVAISSRKHFKRQLVFSGSAINLAAVVTAVQGLARV
jgi:hypothetical protein